MAALRIYSPSDRHDRPAERVLNSGGPLISRAPAGLPAADKGANIALAMEWNQ